MANIFKVGAEASQLSLAENLSSIQSIKGVAMIKEFDKNFRDWVRSACKDWRCSEPSNEYYAKVYKRLPEGLQTSVGLGLKEGLVISQGRTFTLKGQPPKKGPYNWFSRGERRIGKKEPHPNWEYFVQVAEFVRLYHIAKANGMLVNFEDDWIDIALYLNGRLVACYEVKERAGQIQELIKGIKLYQQAVNFTEPDRGNDPLRKAKYIAKRKPEYFCGVAIGARFEYRVSYPEDQALQLTRDVVPWI